MSLLDRVLLARKTAAIERHLSRLAEHLPDVPESLQLWTDTSDIVILRLWLALQGAIDLATSACLHFRLGTPANYEGAFEKLGEANYLEPDLARRLSQGVELRNVIAHTYETLDMARVYRAAKEGPADLRAFLAALERSV